MAKKPRNYKNEYQSYQGTPEQIKRRASRNAARAIMVKAGKAHKGDGKDTEHKLGNPMNNKPSNLKMGSKKANRSFPRTASAKKKNKKD
jgi:hypothetical protein